MHERPGGQSTKRTVALGSRDAGWQTPLMDCAQHSPGRCAIVPPYLLVKVARLTEPRFAGAAEAARQTLLRDQPLHELRTGTPTTHSEQPSIAQRTIWDARGRDLLPGLRMRTEGQPPVADAAVNEAYDGLGSAQLLFSTQFRSDAPSAWTLPLDAVVHVGSRYDNAFWDGERLLLGDGDGQVFGRFTRSLTTIGHELAHGVVQRAVPLVYSGQTGALIESVADVFGSLVEQYANGQSVADAGWLVGTGLFIDGIDCQALRSMKAPGSAYNDDVLGKDPQPDCMADFVDTDEDHAGVHVNCGIPNRAFYLVATALGGNAWEAPGQIWYRTLTGGALPATVDFAGFARETQATAQQLYGLGSAEAGAVVDAWRAVGVLS